MIRVVNKKKKKRDYEKNTAPCDSLLITSVHNNNFVVVDRPSELFTNIVAGTITNFVSSMNQ